MLGNSDQVPGSSALPPTFGNLLLAAASATALNHLWHQSDSEGELQFFELMVTIFKET